RRRSECSQYLDGITAHCGLLAPAVGVLMGVTHGKVNALLIRACFAGIAQRTEASHRSRKKESTSIIFNRGFTLHQQHASGTRAVETSAGTFDDFSGLQ